MLIPVFLVVFWSGKPNSVQLAMFIMALAGLSDIIDGFLARRLNMITTLGKILDPLADKLMVVAALTSLFLVRLVPLWLLMLIVVKELILVFGSGVAVYKKDYDVSANIGGKFATVCIYAAVFASSLKLPGKEVLIYLASLAALLSLGNYLYNYITATRSHM